ncbi:U3 small nucleolar ribonucleoprotein IMP3 isoform 2-T2 [Clarias gariepinus]|uniref:U3 small nucleolar ribonucleoprotein protein IMP3 isoform X2 n=1 Tax=Clarias gariepinus TaxID=13013 RepID=UPI00234DE4A1|nr:U3 small nucleolar ribonucleoprotein protein IMP3 isoform X2 [Clarias gariepinus]
MVRKLRFHEQKLLKKVDFINWEVDNNLHEVKVLRKYRIEKREDYTKYNKLSRSIRELAQKIRDLNEKDGYRAQCTAQLLEKLYGVGLIPTKQSLALANDVNASSFCRPLPHQDYYFQSGRMENHHMFPLYAPSSQTPVTGCRAVTHVRSLSPSPLREFGQSALSSPPSPEIERAISG